MSKTTGILLTLAAAAIVAAAGYVWLMPAQSAADAHFGRGQPGTILFLPAKPRPEERILRHPRVDGSAEDDVWMRDGTTKHIVYDTRMVLRQVTAYFKAPEGVEHGPVMYEKTHDKSGHLASERHLRPDGTLEMDGLYKPDLTYVRHLYFPPVAMPASAVAPTAPGETPDSSAPASPSAASAPALMVAAEKTFDKWWHPVSETDYRPDSTRLLTHTWGDGLDETVTNFAPDGVKILSQVTTGRGKYYTALYYDDGVNIKVEALNTYQGTTFQWYRPDHSLKLKVTLTSGHSDDIVIADEKGKPLIEQVWYPNYSEQMVNGNYPQRLDHFDHLNDAGKMDSRYDIDTKTHKVTTVTVYQGEETWGPRVIYTVGDDGWATSAKTFTDGGNDDGGKSVTHETGKHFDLEPWMLAHPTYELPPLKEGLDLYGAMMRFGWGGGH